MVKSTDIYIPPLTGKPVLISAVGNSPMGTVVFYGPIHANTTGLDCIILNPVKYNIKKL